MINNLLTYRFTAAFEVLLERGAVGELKRARGAGQGHECHLLLHDLVQGQLQKTKPQIQIDNKAVLAMFEKGCAWS